MSTSPVPRSFSARNVKWIRLLRSSRCRILLTIVWYGCITIGSILPTWKTRFHTHSRHHATLHCGAFVLTELVTLVLNPWHGSPVFSTSIVIGFALLTENLQKSTYTIPFEWGDLVVDTAAVVATALVFLGVRWSKRRIASEKRLAPDLSQIPDVAIPNRR